MAASVACAFFFDAEPAGGPGRQALDACALCAKPLARDSDVFMYRGDTPYCSEECRHEQMRLDAVCARQRRRQPKVSVGSMAARRTQRFSAETESHRGQRQSTKVSTASEPARPAAESFAWIDNV